MAHPDVTVIDDGTIADSRGSINIDDEGNELIEHVEVDATHLGLGFSAEVFQVVAERLARHGVELRTTDDARALLHADGYDAMTQPAGPDDFDQEWLALILGVKLVDGLDEAIAHIQEHSTEHSDSILTNTDAHAERFVNAVNSAAVYVNASTRFTDGGQFGLGAEVAVSTQKLHARGPMGLEELTTYKWIGIGDGHVRE